MSFRAFIDNIVVLVDVGLRVLKLEEARLWSCVRPRGFGVLKQTGEDSMASLFTYSQGLLAVPAGVVSQRVNISVDGVAQGEQLLPADATEAIFKAGDVGATVVFNLDYVDAAGNDSANAETSFIVADAIAPDAPAGFGVLTQTGEETV
jgi:hypothetical protein